MIQEGEEIKEIIGTPDYVGQSFIITITISIDMDLETIKVTMISNNATDLLPIFLLAGLYSAPPITNTIFASLSIRGGMRSNL